MLSTRLCLFGVEDTAHSGVPQNIWWTDHSRGILPVSCIDQ